VVSRPGLASPRWGEPTSVWWGERRSQGGSVGTRGGVPGVSADEHHQPPGRARSHRDRGTDVRDALAWDG